MIEVWTGRFAVVGDLQRTSRAEFWKESNPEERHRRGPALRNAFARFPRLAASRWYAETYGSLRLLFLDSNESAVGAAAWRLEADWLDAELARANAEQAVKGVVVFAHHPPYTNSTVTGDELHVRRAFVPPFAAAKKTIAMVCGHVHSYEHFVRGGKTFLVAGGGGGPRVRLARGAARRHADDVFDGLDVRHFHFLLCTPGPSGLDVEVVGLEKGRETFFPLARFALAWPP